MDHYINTLDHYINTLRPIVLHNKKKRNRVKDNDLHGGRGDLKYVQLVTISIIIGMHAHGT